MPSSIVRSSILTCLVVYDSKSDFDLETYHQNSTYFTVHVIKFRPKSDIFKDSLASDIKNNKYFCFLNSHGTEYRESATGQPEHHGAPWYRWDSVCFNLLVPFRSSGTILKSSSILKRVKMCEEDMCA